MTLVWGAKAPALFWYRGGYYSPTDLVFLIFMNCIVASFTFHFAQLDCQMWNKMYTFIICNAFNLLIPTLSYACDSIANK